MLHNQNSIFLQNLSNDFIKEIKIDTKYFIEYFDQDGNSFGLYEGKLIGNKIKHCLIPTHNVSLSAARLKTVKGDNFSYNPMRNFEKPFYLKQGDNFHFQFKINGWKDL